VLGRDRPIVLATNGLALTEAQADALASVGANVWVSLHMLAKAQPAIDMLRRRGILAGISTDPATAANDWAGQVAWKRPDYRMLCPWLRQGWLFVCSDGRISTCCLDADGRGILGKLGDDPEALELQQYELCAKCYQEP